MTQSPTYSIIIPHKNIPRLLERCLHSIPQRDDLEVLIIDDNSDSSIVDFDHFPGKDRQDVKIIFDKSAKGAGHARNIGMNHAKGRWLIFADADDYFNYGIRDILDEYRDDEADIVFFSVLVLDSQTYNFSHHRLNYLSYEIEKYKKGNKNSEIFLRYVHGPCWSKLFKKEFVTDHHICFQETKIFNDAQFSYMTGYYAEKIKADSRALYSLTYRPGSISYSLLTEEKIIEKVKVQAERIRFLEQHNVHIPSYFLFSDTNVKIKKTPFRFPFIPTLVDLLEKKNQNLYNKCLSIIIENKVFPQDKIPSMIKSEKRRRIIARLRVKYAFRTRFMNFLHKK